MVYREGVLEKWWIEHTEDHKRFTKSHRTSGGFHKPPAKFLLMHMPLSRIIGGMDAAKNIKDVLSKQSFVIFAYLFGSMAKGTTHGLSDCDIAVYLDEARTPDPPYGIRSYLAALFAGKLSTDKIQIVILNDADPLLAYEVVDSGILIFGRNKSIHHNYVFCAYRRYFDLQVLYRLQDEALIARVNNGTYGGVQNDR